MKPMIVIIATVSEEKKWTVLHRKGEKPKQNQEEWKEAFSVMEFVSFGYLVTKQFLIRQESYLNQGPIRMICFISVDHAPLDREKKSYLSMSGKLTRHCLHSAGWLVNAL